jgi:hypothetical protein
MKYGADPPFVPVAVNASFKGFFRYVRRKKPGSPAARADINRKAGIACFFAVFKQKPYVFAFWSVVNKLTPYIELRVNS